MDYVVVDSSVAIKWFTVEPYTAEARRVLDGYQAGSLTLLAPDLINAEVGNIVWKKHRFQGLPAADAQRIIDTFRTLALALTPTAMLLEDAFRLALAHQRTVYDAMYLALSQREKCRLVTADEKLFNSLHSAFRDLTWVANWV